MAAQTGSSRSRRSSVDRRRDARPAPAASRSGRGGRVAPGSATWASVRRPPGVSFDRGEPGLAVGDAARPGSPQRGRPRSPGRTGRRGPGRGSRRRSAGSRRPRRATSAGRHRRCRVSTGGRETDRRPVRSRAAAASRSRWFRGTTASSSPWASRTGPSIPGDRGRGADRRHDVAARPEVDPRGQPRERVGDRGPGSAAGRAGTSGA